MFVACVVLLSWLAHYYKANAPDAIDRAWIAERRGEIPQIERDFELSRERLDTLRRGQFAANNGRAQRVWISFGPENARELVRFEDWHTIEWLPPEELDAILFLLFSEELEHNFISIRGTVNSTIYPGSGGAGALRGMQILHPRVDPQQIYRDDWHREIDTYIIYNWHLEYGYTLQIYTARGQWSVGPAPHEIARMRTLWVIAPLAAGTVVVFVRLLSHYKKLRLEII